MEYGFRKDMREYLVKLYQHRAPTEQELETMVIAYLAGAEEEGMSLESLGNAFKRQKGLEKVCETIQKMRQTRESIVWPNAPARF